MVPPAVLVDRLAERLARFAVLLLPSALRSLYEVVYWVPAGGVDSDESVREVLMRSRRLLRLDLFPVSPGAAAIQRSLVLLSLHDEAVFWASVGPLSDRLWCWPVVRCSLAKDIFPVPLERGVLSPAVRVEVQRRQVLQEEVWSSQKDEHDRERAEAPPRRGQTDTERHVDQ